MSTALRALGVLVLLSVALFLVALLTVAAVGFGCLALGHALRKPPPTIRLEPRN